jgi:integrase
MIDKNLTSKYTLNENLENGTGAEEVMPTIEGDTNMGRQRIHVTLPSGELVWITGSTYSELIQKALIKYGGSKDNIPKGTSESFREYTEKIFDVFLKPRWRESTAKTNRYLLDKHILPYFGSIPVSSVDVLQVQRFFQTKQHLSKSYTKQMLIMLHEIFENAVEDGMIKSDPTQSKRIILPQKVTKRNSLEPEEYYDIISHLKELPQEEALFMALLCFTGMRRGELLGLKWDRILDDKILVRAEVTFDGNAAVYNDYTKSISGIRDIPIPEELRPYLAFRGSGFVFGKDKPFTQCKFTRMWQRIDKKICLHGATPHTFRHTYLSILASSNVDPKTIQALAGHADFSFTFNKYINQNGSNMQDAGAKFSNHIQKLTEKLTNQSFS